MNIDRSMVFFSGCYLLMFLSFKWKVSHAIWDTKFVRIYSIIVGLYTIALGIFFNKDLSIILFVLDLVLYLILDISFIMIKVKTEQKGIIRNLQLGICSIFIILSLYMAYLDVNEIYASIQLLSAMMIVLSVPFGELRSIRKKIQSENRIK